MNERIRKLAEEATEIVEVIGRGGNTRSYARFDRQKFAELIVLECAEVVEDSGWVLPRDYRCADQANLVKEHFGIDQ